MSTHDVKCENEKITSFPLIIDIMSATAVLTDVQPVHICYHLKNCVSGFDDPLM